MAGGCELFGTIALRSNLIRQADLSKALAIQEAQTGAERMPLGQILVAMGALRPIDVKHIRDMVTLMHQRSRRARFGLAVIQNGFATHDQVIECLKIQGKTKGVKRIGEILVERRIITEQQCNALVRGLQRLEESGEEPASNLVQALRRIGKDEAPPSAEALRGSRLRDAEALIAEGVKSMTHLGILSHVVHKQAMTYALRDFQEALAEGRKEIRSALGDLMKICLLVQLGSWLSRRYQYTDDSAARQRVANLMGLAGEPATRRQIFELLLRRRSPRTVD